MSEYEIIKSKIVSHAEIVVCLFDHCNMRCVFCPQDHGDLLGASEAEIMAKAPLIIDWINQNLKSKYFKIHLMGGELFQDVWIRRGFLEIYQKFLDEISAKIKSDYKVVFNFITNLVFTESDKVKQFLDKNNFKISVSYDSVGRFNGGQKKIFLQNIDFFQNYIEMISLVMTRMNMQAVTSGDPVFDLLYSKFTCDWDQFLPSVEKSKELMPSETESYEFYKVLIDRYPECLNISHFVTKDEHQKMICTRGNSLTVLKDGTIPKGCSGAVFLKDAGTKDLGGEVIVENFLSNYNCFECQYFSKCPFTCFIKNDYKHIKRDLGECVFKAVFKYVDSKS